MYIYIEMMICCKILVTDGPQQLLILKKKVLSWSLVSMTDILTGLEDLQIDRLTRHLQGMITNLITQVSRIKFLSKSINYGFCYLTQLNEVHMSHFAYACKTEGQNGISRLISALCVNCVISILEYSRLNHLDKYLV